MPRPFMSRSLPLLGLAALLTALALGGVCRADNKKAPAPPKPSKEAIEAEKKAAEQAQKQEKNLVKQEQNGEMVEVIKEAYILVAAANKDYNGHRGKAMGHIQEAAKIMDSHILAHGSVAQKIKAMQEAQAAGQAKAMDKFNVPVKEGQAVSDALLFQAGILLEKVAPALAQTGHSGTLGHVKSAIAELNLALATR